MSDMSAPSPHLQQLIGQVVVLDVQAPFVYVGTLREFDHRYLVLTDADVHDLRDTTTTRDYDGYNRLTWKAAQSALA